jgi:hypothetical protein
MAKCKTKMPYHVPVAWVREFGKGRLFYTNLGHNEGTWTNPQFRDHLVAGIRWALRLEDGPAEPNPALQYAEQARAFAWVTASALGKNAEELAEKASKAALADAAWGEKTYADVFKIRDLNRRREGARNDAKKKADAAAKAAPEAKEKAEKEAKAAADAASKAEADYKDAAAGLLAEIEKK